MEQLKHASGWLKVLMLVMGLGLFTQLSGLTFNNDGSRYAVQVYLLLLLPSLVLLIWMRGAFGFWKQFPALLLLLLMGWGLLVAWTCDGSGRSMGYWFKVMLLILLFVFAVACQVQSERHFCSFIVAALAVVALFAWLTLYYQFGVLERPMAYEDIRLDRLSALGWRGYADLDHPIVAGLYYGVFAVLLTWLFVRFSVSSLQVALLVIGMVGLLLYVLFTFSRGAWFSLLSGGLVLLLLFPNLKSRSLLSLGFLLLSITACLFWPEVQNERAVGVNNRDWIWRAWFERLPEFWLWGRGAGADFVYTFSYGVSVRHAHSLYLQLWYEYGLVGILLFVALLISLLWKGWTCRAQPLARLGLALLVFAMVAMVSDVYAIFQRPSPYWVLFWFPVGILLGVRKLESESARP